MKKTFFVFIAGILILNSGCDFSDGEKTNSTFDFSETQEITISEDSPVIEEVLFNTGKVSLSGNLSGKNLYFVQMNPSDYDISLDGAKYTGKINKSGEEENLLTSSDEIPRNLQTYNQGEFYDSLNKKFYCNTKTNQKLIDLFLNKNKARSALAESDSVEPDYENQFEVGDTKQIWLLGTENSFEKKGCTLRANGEYCNVWICDDNFTENQTITEENKQNGEVNSQIAKTYAQKFDSIYPLIRYVFGEEPEILLDTSTEEVNISEKSDTKSRINIVIYDIPTDGVMGFTNTLDFYFSSDENDSYYKETQYSNLGKYFYVDSIYSAEDETETISTLAHEFQHMINFNKKTLKLEKNPSTEFNEMCSLICEDMISEFLYADIESENYLGDRIQTFNANYFASGISQYRDDEYSYYSYATSYVFGAWLARQYGGAELAKEMLDNDFLDDECIVKAVNSLNGETFTFEDLMKQFIQAMILKDSEFTLNKDAEQTLTYSNDSITYDYPMPKIDLWDKKYAPKNIEGYEDYYEYSIASESYDFYGPFLFSYEYGPSPLRKEYGLSIQLLYTFEDEESTSYEISFTTMSYDPNIKNIKNYLVIQ